MKIRKEARKLAREMFRSCLVNGQFQATRARDVTDLVIGRRPRFYEQALKAFARLVRLENARHHAVICSAQPLDAAEKKAIEAKVRASFGAEITTEFQSDESLIGGLRIQVGSEVWDGSVRSRLELLQKSL